MGSISAKKLNVAAFTMRDAKRAAPVVEEEEEEDAPMLMDPELATLRAVLDKADAVIEVLDARDPQTFRSAALEKHIMEGNKKLMLVLNKIDLCPREAVAAWYSHLRGEQPTFLFRSASSCLPVAPIAPDVKGKAKASTNDAIGAGAILDQLRSWAAEKKGDTPFTVAVVGVTNSGKSSLVNSLLKKSALPVYTLATSSRGPTTTEVPQEVSLDATLSVLDTPGLAWTPLSSDDDSANAVRARDILMRNKGRIDRLKDPEPAVENFVSRATTEDLMLLYSLPAFIKDDSEAFLKGVARAKQLIKKHGAIDLTTAARVVLRDWSTGRIKWYTPGPAAADAAQADEAILSRLSTRKELRRAGGLVKLTPGTVETRTVDLEAPWVHVTGAPVRTGEDDDDDDWEDVDEDEDMDDGESEDGEMDEDEEDDEDEEEELPAPPPKRKRQAGDQSLPPPPAKKVAFAAKTKVTARSAPAASQPTKSVLKATTTTSSSVKTVTSSSVKTASTSAKTAKTVTKAAKTVPKVAPPTKAPRVANVGKKTSGKPTGENEYDFGSFF